MHLKALELTGFKSFAEKTTVEFNRGITSIVGPNGSGKSNILDAILWVLGEQSYKNIRAKESSDVIFSGGKNKKARSMAEVSLVVENEDRYLDIDFSEVKITRRIYRSGENEYLINNRKVRLKDINNLFMDTGIGKQAYSIIGQGRVERIISSSPKEIKEIIEEAAGVKRAKIEKEDSIRKLKEVKSEAEKIEFVEKELAGRVAQLREEERKARLYKSFSEKIDAQRLMILEYSLFEEEKLYKEYEEKRSGLEKIIEGTKDEYALEQEKLSTTVTSAEERYGRLTASKKENEENIVEMESLREEYSELLNRLSNLDIQSSEKESRQKNLQKDIDEKEDQLSKSRNELDRILKELNKSEAQKKDVELKAEELKSKREAITGELKKMAQKNQDMEVDKIKIQSENDEIQKRMNGAAAALKRQEKEKEEVEREFAELSLQKTEFAQNGESIEKIRKEKEEVLKRVNEEIDKLSHSFNTLNKEKNELNYKYESLNARKKANENIIERNETFAGAVKHILKEGIKGVIGAFINLIEIPDGYEEAVQTLSGGYFQDIVVDNTGTAQHCIEILKDRKLGRCSFLPMEGIKSGKVLNTVPHRNGIIGFARDIVIHKPEMEKIVQFVYGNAVIVDSLSVGRELLKEGFNDRIVTLEGDIISARGRMTGGYSRKGKDELLERKKSLKGINQEIDEVKVLLKEMEIRSGSLAIQINKVEQQRASVLEEVEKIRIDYRQFGSILEDFNMEYARKERELATLSYEIGQNEEFLSSGENKIAENIEIAGKIEGLIEQNRNRMSELEKELEDTGNSEGYVQELAKMETECVVLAERAGNNKSRYLEIESDYRKLIEEKKELEEFQERKGVLKGEIEEKIALKKEDISRRSEESKKIGELIKELEKEIKELESAEKELIRKVKDIEMKKREEESDFRKILEKMSENDRKREAYISEIREMDVERIKESEEYGPLGSLNELNSVKRKLSLNEKSRTDIGSVNLSSIDEYERENERYTILVNQKRDLLDSRESLLRLIRDIEEEIIGKFNFALGEVNKNFSYMCETILNGAKGTLKLLDEENLLETGLELSVKYKNKPEQTLMLLSGGEKSMLAVCFIMAIFMFRPSPFTFFDEIEAALDEENTKKIVALLNRFITKSQFILITHNKETMKGSHRLYGVTMNKEIGESRIIAVDV